MYGKVIYFSISAILGIVASYTTFHWLFLIIGITYILYIKRKLPNFIFIGCLMMFAVFLIYFKLVDSFNISHFSPSTNRITGEIISMPKIDGDKFTTIIDTKINEKLMISYTIPSLKEKEALSTLTVGMTCKFDGQIKKPPTARNPNSFDYGQYLYFQKIHYLLIPGKINISTCKKTTYSISEYLTMIRQRGVSFIENHYPNESASMVEALIFGKQDDISEETINAYQSLGIIHILAISGSHISLLAGMLFFIGIRLGMTRDRMHLFLFLCIPAYIFMAGAAPSVVRAGVMTMIGIVLLRFPHYLNSLDAVGISCLLMLLYNPYCLFQIGFQLSFIVSTALILSVRMFLKGNRGYFWQLCFVTFIAQIIVFPLILYYFYEISLLSFVANLIFIPLFSFVLLPLAILSYLFEMSFPFLGDPLIIILSYLINLCNTFTIFLSSFHSFSFSFGKTPQILFISYYLCIFMMITKLEKQKNIIFSLFCLFLILFIHWNWYSFNPNGTITMIDVGQGDSFLIELPYRKAVYLIDTGGTTTYFDKANWRNKSNQFSIGDDVLLPFLKSKGIRKIDKLILTHGDTDHMGAASKLIPKIKIKKVYFPLGPSYDEVEKNLFIQIFKAKIPLELVESGDRWSVDGIPFYILSPIGTEQKQNNRSIVILTKIGGLKWLFTGDLEQDGESALLRRYPYLNIDVLKIGHHGSISSSSEEFLNKLSPKVALISVGEHNRFHHPHPNIIQRLKSRKIFIMRTDLNGAVQYKFTSKNGTFFTQIPYDMVAK